MSKKLRVYFFGKTGITNESTIGFATTLLNIPFVVDCDINIDLSMDTVKAYNNFLKATDYDAFVSMPCHMTGFEFVRDALGRKDPHACIIGRYVKPVIDWEGPLVSYNYDVKGDAYVPLPEPLTEVPDAFVSFRSRLPGNAPMDAAQMIRVLNADAVVDPTTTVGVFAKHVFKGAVGLRSYVR
jgi:hypothetical protein